MTDARARIFEISDAYVDWFGAAFPTGATAAGITDHEAELTDHALSRLSGVEGVTIVGRAQDRGGVISFTLKGAHAHDVATLLDRQGIAVRAGHHCAEPLMRRLGVDSTARASFAMYTTHDEIDMLADTLTRVREFFA